LKGVEDAARCVELAVVPAEVARVVEGDPLARPRREADAALLDQPTDELAVVRDLVALA